MTMKQIAARALTQLAYNVPIGGHYPIEIAHPIERRFDLIGYTSFKVAAIRQGIITMAQADLKRTLTPDQYHWHGLTQ
jgi:hypothetical protein